MTDMRYPWTGAEIRDWAERIARRVDDGLSTASMDLDHQGMELDVWHLHVERTEKGRRKREAERAEELAEAAED